MLQNEGMHEDRHRAVRRLRRSLVGRLITVSAAERVPNGVGGGRRSDSPVTVPLRVLGGVGPTMRSYSTNAKGNLDGR